MNDNKCYKQLASLLHSGINYIDSPIAQIYKVDGLGNVPECNIQDIQSFLAFINAKTNTTTSTVYKDGVRAYIERTIHISSYSREKLGEILLSKL